MKKIISMSFLLVFTLMQALVAQNVSPDQLKTEYEALGKRLSEKMNDIKSREEFQKFMQERNTQLGELLKKCESGQESPELNILKGKILFDLNRFDEAEKLFNPLAAGNSALAIEAKFQQVKILSRTRKFSEMYDLFQSIEKDLPRNDDYYMICLMVMRTYDDEGIQEKYARKFLDAGDLSEEMRKYVPMVYGFLADTAKSKKDLDKARRYLQEGLEKAKDPQGQHSLKMAMVQLDLTGNPPPAISAETWLNGDSLELGALKGKVVLIDFWATWCGPCRQVIPALVELYDQYKEKGLVVIGFTRLYENYNDEQGSKGKVTAEEEIRLVREFLKRFKITYPIAISHQVKDNPNFNAYGISGIPTLIMIDRGGNIVDIHVGSGNEEELKQAVIKLLEN